MRKFNIFLILYFVVLALLFVTNVILETNSEYALTMLYTPYPYYIAVALIILEVWELFIRVMQAFGGNSLVAVLIKLVLLTVGLFATVVVIFFTLFFGGDASSENIGGTEYVVIERGALAAATKHYHEKKNIFLMKKKESYSHKI